MSYTPMRPVNLTLSDFMDLEFHLMDTRPGVNRKRLPSAVWTA